MEHLKMKLYPLPWPIVETILACVRTEDSSVI